MTGELEPARRLMDGLAEIADLSMAREPTCPARHLGAAAALLGRPDEAMAYYQRALDACAKLRFRPDTALTRLQLAELLLEHYPDERDAAIEHLDFAIAEFREMKMQPSLERALRRTANLAAWEGGRMVGVARVLTDGHRYACLVEVLVDPDYRRRGIGRELARRAGGLASVPISATSECEPLLDRLTRAAR